MFEGMQLVGSKFNEGEYFLPELIVAGEAMAEQLKFLEPYMTKTAESNIGTVVLGTVEGDLHSIGKDIFGMFMKASGFRVIDLGVDVSAEKFVEAVQTYKPAIVAMSALLTISMPEMETVISRLVKNGLRDQIKIIVGGAPLSIEYSNKIGADAFGPNAIAGVSICKEWMERSD
jgi:5-methyltetrahydrofolate--homocysteine methyltransferase